MKVRHSSPGKVGEPLPAKAWKWQKEEIPTNLVKATDVEERSLEDQNPWSKVIQGSHFQRWSSVERGSVRNKHPNIYLLLPSDHQPILPNGQTQQAARGKLASVVAWVTEGKSASWQPEQGLEG